MEHGTDIQELGSPGENRNRKQYYEAPATIDSLLPLQRVKLNDTPTGAGRMGYSGFELGLRWKKHSADFTEK